MRTPVTHGLDTVYTVYTVHTVYSLHSLHSLSLLETLYGFDLHVAGGLESSFPPVGIVPFHSEYVDGVFLVD